MYTIAMIIIVMLMLVVMVFGKLVKGFLIATIPSLASTLSFLSVLELAEECSFSQKKKNCPCPAERDSSYVFRFFQSKFSWLA